MQIIAGQLKFIEDELWNLTDVLARIIGSALQQFAAQPLNTYPTDMDSLEDWKAELERVAATLQEKEPDITLYTMEDTEPDGAFDVDMNDFLQRREEAMQWYAEHQHLLWD